MNLNLNSVLGILLCMLLMPPTYALAVIYCQMGKPFRSRIEIAVLALSEVTLLRIWFVFGKCKLSNFMFLMLVIMLYGMTILCMTDYWQKLVPNRILLWLLLIWVLAMGNYAIRDMNGMIRHMFGVILGVIFCMISFGFCYLLSRGSMGAGDVKLSVIMGLYLTGEYVVGAVFYGCILSACFSIAMLACRKVTRKDSIPFVPFLYLGVIIRYFVG